MGSWFSVCVALGNIRVGNSARHGTSTLPHVTCCIQMHSRRPGRHLSPLFACTMCLQAWGRYNEVVVCLNLLVIILVHLYSSPYQNHNLTFTFIHIQSCKQSTPQPFLLLFNFTIHTMYRKVKLYVPLHSFTRTRYHLPL